MNGSSLKDHGQRSFKALLVHILKTIFNCYGHENGTKEKVDISQFVFDHFHPIIRMTRIPFYA